MGGASVIYSRLTFAAHRNISPLSYILSRDFLLGTSIHNYRYYEIQQILISLTFLESQLTNKMASLCKAATLWFIFKPAAHTSLRASNFESLFCKIFFDGCCCLQLPHFFCAQNIEVLQKWQLFFTDPPAILKTQRGENERERDR